MIERTSNFWHLNVNRYPSVILEIDYTPSVLVIDTNFYVTKQKYPYIQAQKRNASGGYDMQQIYVLLLLSGVLL